MKNLELDSGSICRCRRLACYFWEVGRLFVCTACICSHRLCDRIMCAVLDKKLSSEVASGYFQKVLIFSLVAIGHLIDKSVIGDGSVIRTAVIFFYLSNEGVSILKIQRTSSMPVPQKLKVF